MSDSPKKLPPALEALEPLEPLTLPQGAEISLRRLELYQHRHLSISKEEAHARIEEAQSMSEQARFQFAIPAEEATKQIDHESARNALVVKYICITVGSCVLAGILGTVIRPEAALYIWRIVGVVSVVFGGLGGAVVWRGKRSRERQPGGTPRNQP